MWSYGFCSKTTLFVFLKSGTKHGVVHNNSVTLRVIIRQLSANKRFQITYLRMRVLYNSNKMILFANGNGLIWPKITLFLR